MKKILTSFILSLAAVFGIVAMTPGVYANTSNNLISVTGLGNVNTIHIDGQGGSYYIYFDGVKYSEWGSSGFIGDYIDNYAEDFTNPNVGYAVEFKGSNGQPLYITGFGNVNTIHIDGQGGSYYIYFDGVKYSEWGSSGFIGDYIDNYAEDFTNPNVGYAVEIKSDTRPAIDGQENFVTSVDETKPVSFFQGYLSAYDETDGDLTDSIYIVSDQYTPNRSTLGTWQVTFGVKDGANNESTLTINITVADITKPVITGNTSTVEISYTQTWNISNFRSTLTVTDNYASMTNSDITIKSDGYTSNKTNLGTYDVVFKATDPSGNEATFTKKVTVIDDVAPTFSGPTTLSKPSTSILTLNEIKAQLSAQDVKDGNRTSSIQVVEDNYTGKGNLVGSYTIRFSVADTKGNTAYHIVTVTVHDNIPPVWYIQDGVSIVLVPPTALTQQQIIDMLVATGQISVQSTTQINFFLNEYSGNETEPGVYLIGVNLSDTAGNSQVHNLAITVLEGEDEDPITLEPEEKNVWDHLVSFWNGTVDVYETSKTWVQENPWLASGIGIGALVLVLGSVVVFSNKRRY